MRAFAVLGLFFSTPSWEIGLGKLLRSDLFCVEWDVKPQLSQLAACCSGWYRCVLSDAAVVGVLMQEMPTVKASCQFLVSLLDFTLNFQKTSQVAEQNKKVKVAHSRLPSVGFQSWSRFLAVSLQVMWVINPTVGCHYWAECWSDYYMFNWNCPQCVVSCPVWLNLCYMRMARACVCVCEVVAAVSYWTAGGQSDSQSARTVTRRCSASGQSMPGVSNSSQHVGRGGR